MWSPHQHRSNAQPHRDVDMSSTAKIRHNTMPRDVGADRNDGDTYRHAKTECNGEEVLAPRIEIELFM